MPGAPMTADPATQAAGRAESTPDGAEHRAALVVQGLSKHFGDRVAYEGVSFEVGYGEVFGFLGPNGAGKTTTVRTLGTLIAPTSGSAIVAGVPLRAENGPAIRARISIMPESPGLYLRLTVAENLQCFASPGCMSWTTFTGESSVRWERSTCSSERAIRADRCRRACASASRSPARY
jgi:ABC-type uncharacterized transport system ATPase subunit